MMQQMQRFDVVVIGGGGAALRAALSAWRCGAGTALLCKAEAGKSGATYHSVAEVGAFNVPDGAIDPTDDPEAFYQDMKNASLGMARLPLCRILAEQAESALRDLEEIGGGQVFSKAGGNFKGYQACFSTKPRSHVVENHFKPILKALREALQQTDVTVFNQLQAVDLLNVNGVVGGVLALDENGGPVTIHAKSVILATGGASRLFKRNMYPADITGDGYAMAYRAGAKLSNMEFIQAGIGVAHPFINLFGNYLWKAFPRIRSARGENLLLKYGGSERAAREALEQKTHFPFSTRDASKLIEIAVQSEINRGGGTENGNVYLDFLDTDFSALLRRDSEFASMWKYTYEWHREKGVDFYRQPIEIACFAHAVNGGIWIDEHAESNVEGLYAAGETAAGPHGADRLGGNMSVTCQVFGNLAGQFAAAHAADTGHFLDTAKSEREILDRLRAHRTGYDADLPQLLRRLQEESDRALLIVRSEERLRDYQTALREIQTVLNRGCRPRDERLLLQLENLTTVGEMIATASRARKESRGSHYRKDYPLPADTMERNLMLRQTESGMGCDWET